MTFDLPHALLIASLLLATGCETDIGRDSADEHDKTRLMYAAEQADTAEIRRLLDDGARVNQRVRPHPGLRVLIAFLAWMQELPDRDPGYTALHYALQSRQLAAAELLLAAGADPSPPGEALSPLHLVLVGGMAREGLPLLLRYGAEVRPGEDGHDPGPLAAAAVGNRDTMALRLLLESGADPNAGNALIVAAMQGDSASAELLLAAGADPRQTQPNTGWTAAMVARQRGHIALAERLGGGGGSQDQLTVDLEAALNQRDTAAVRVLLAKGANPRSLTSTGQPVLAEAVRSGNPTIVELLLLAGASPDVEQYGVPVFNLAQQLGDTAMVATLLRHGANPRIPGAATYAAGSGSVALLQQLRAAGANLREHNDEPLRQAAFGAHADAVRYLLSIGANPNATDGHGLTPLDRAVGQLSRETVRALLEAGADPNAGTDGHTNLMSAAMSGDTLLMALLLEFRADPQRRDAQGKSAADYARGAGQQHAVQWLARRTGRP